MAEKKQSKGLSGLMNTIQSSLDNIYQSTHMTSVMNRKDISNIKNKMDSAINNLVSTNKNNIGTANLSNLLSKNNIRDQLNGNRKGGNMVRSIEDLFSDEQSLQGVTYLLEQNKSIIDFDQEIDIILKYFTVLNETLELKKDTVLAADNNNKDYLNFIPINIEKDVDYDNNIKEIKKAYNLVEEFDDIYDKIAKYGEVFYYIVPYKKALSKLLNNKNNNIPSFANESSQYIQCEYNSIIEATVDFDKGELFTSNKIDRLDLDDTIDGISEKFKVELYTNGILNNSVNECVSINEASTRLNKILGRDTVISSLDSDGLEAPDGIIDSSKKVSENDIKINGAIFKELKRENIIPIYIDKTPLGYYYVECEFDQFLNSTKAFNNPLLSTKNSSTSLDNLSRQKKKEEMMNKLSKTLSKFIDVNFINNNQDMADQIYMILNHNELNNNKKLSKLKVTYLPPEDVEHLYFKLDPVTHRGISDLQKALIPAKLYICLYITNALAILTRGYDKRAYYVKQSVDTNIAQSLITVINQIKRGNFGAREISSIKNILGVTGKFQDLVIPMTSTGESPVQMEVMQGQEINTQEEFSQRLEQMAIEALDIPYEFVQSRNQVEFAIRLTMSNGKVLRKSYKRQSVVELFGSRIGTKLYNYHFNTNCTLQLVLPPPTFLSISNANQLITNVNETVQNIVNMEMDQDSDPMLIRIFTNKLMRHYLSTYIDASNIDRLKEEAQMEFSKLKKNEEQ